MSYASMIRPRTPVYEEFIKNIHRVFDHIHGADAVNETFSGLTQKILSDLVKTYDKTVLDRYYTIYKCLEKNGLFEDDNNNKNTYKTSMYICAIQHYYD